MKSIFVRSLDGKISVRIDSEDDEKFVIFAAKVVSKIHVDLSQLKFTFAVDESSPTEIETKSKENEDKTNNNPQQPELTKPKSMFPSLVRSASLKIGKNTAAGIRPVVNPYSSALRRWAAIASLHTDNNPASEEGSANKNDIAIPMRALQHARKIEPENIEELQKIAELKQTSAPPPLGNTDPFCLTCGGIISAENLYSNSVCFTERSNSCGHLFCARCAVLHIRSISKLHAFPARCPTCVELYPEPENIEQVRPSFIARSAITHIMALGFIDEHEWHRFTWTQDAATGANNPLLKHDNEMNQGNESLSMSFSSDVKALLRNQRIQHNEADITPLTIKGKSHIMLSYSIHNTTKVIRSENPLTILGKSKDSRGFIYFEIKLEAMGYNPSNQISIGIINSLNYNKKRHIGWDNGGYGYYADNGCKYISGSPCQMYGPIWLKFDIIGCYLDFNTGKLYFTRNGTLLNRAAIVHDCEDQTWYAAAALSSPGSMVAFNFGPSFVYKGIRHNNGDSFSKHKPSIIISSDINASEKEEPEFMRMSSDLVGELKDDNRIKPNLPKKGGRSMHPRKKRAISTIPPPPYIDMSVFSAPNYYNPHISQPPPMYTPEEVPDFMRMSSDLISSYKEPDRFDQPPIYKESKANIPPPPYVDMSLFSAPNYHNPYINQPPMYTPEEVPDFMRMSSDLISSYKEPDRFDQPPIYKESKANIPPPPPLLNKPPTYTPEGVPDFMRMSSDLYKEPNDSKKSRYDFDDYDYYTDSEPDDSDDPDFTEDFDGVLADMFSDEVKSPPVSSSGWLGRHDQKIKIDKLTAIYRGSSGKAPIAVVQSLNRLVSCPNKDYYFEIKINSLGDSDSGIATVGLATTSYSLSRQPGWDPRSYGYHGDDGKIFHYSFKEANGRNSGRLYGPKWEVGDVIGCQFRRFEKEIWFLRNGHLLGCAFHDVDADVVWHATVGMRGNGLSITFNFTGPFVWQDAPTPRIILPEVKEEKKEQVGVQLAAAVLKMPSLKKQPSEYDSSDCTICYSEPCKVCFTGGCHHGYCLDCASRYLKSIMEEGNFPARCPGCIEENPKPDNELQLANSLISERALARLLRMGAIDEDFFNRFVTQQILMAVKPENSATCPSCGICSWLDLKNTVPKATCPNCALCFCNVCQVPWHVDLDCTEYMESRHGKDDGTAELIKSSSKACPQCGTPISHYFQHACHHIKPGSGKRGGCPGCGYHFCYTCLKKYPHEPGVRDCPLFCPADRSCGCPLCPDCKAGQRCPHCDGCPVCEPDGRPAHHFNYHPARDDDLRDTCVVFEGCCVPMLTPAIVFTTIVLCICLEIYSFPPYVVMIPFEVFICIILVLFILMHKYAKLGEIDQFHGPFGECYQEFDAENTNSAKYGITTSVVCIFLFSTLLLFRIAGVAISYYVVFLPLGILAILVLAAKNLNCYDDEENYYFSIGMFSILVPFFIMLMLKLAGVNMPLQYVLIPFFIIDGICLLAFCYIMSCGDDEDDKWLGCVLFTFMGLLTLGEIFLCYWDAGVFPFYVGGIFLLITVGLLLLGGFVYGIVICDDHFEDVCDRCCDWICDDLFCECCEDCECCDCCEDCCDTLCDEWCECECCDDCCDTCDDCY